MAYAEDAENTSAGHEGLEVENWATKPADEIGTELENLAGEYYGALDAAGMIDLWKSAHAAFYGLSRDGNGHESSKIVEFGDDGEKLGVRSNQLRSLLKYIMSSTTSTRPSTKPRASNSTAKALAQIPTATRVLDYYNRVKRKNRALKGAALRALIYGKGYLWQSWDPTAGKTVNHAQSPDAPEDNKPEGDLFFRACSPLEVVCDLDRDPYDHDWFMVRRPRNRYDLVAIAHGDQELQDRILGIDEDCIEETMRKRIHFGVSNKDSNDLVFEYHFMHKITPALPQGRYVIMVGKGVILFDGPLPFDRLTVDELVPEEFLEAGPLGYASAWDLLGMQDAYDGLLSTCITNFDAFGHNDLLLPETSELGVEEVRDGLNIIRYPAGEFNKPSVLEKFSIREEVFKLREWIQQDMRVSQGVSETSLGQANANLSGAAMALLNAQTIHFQNDFMEAYNSLVEDSDTNTILIVKRYATTERIAMISGANDPDGLVSFKGDQIDEIERIEVEQVNPIFNTLAGKFDIANNLLERGMLTDIGQYYQVLETGRTEVITDPKRLENLYGETVREALQKGVACVPGTTPDPMTGQPNMIVEGFPAVWTDDPRVHLKIAKSVLDSPEGRKNPKVTAAAVTYALDVMRVWRTAPVDGLNLLGYPLPPPPPGAPGAEDPNAHRSAGSGGDAPPAAIKAGGKANGDGTASNQAAPDEGAGVPSLPKPAKPAQPPQEN